MPLEQIDPFSFLSLINKHPNVYRRAEFVNKILGQNILNIDIENFSGVPTSQGTAALFFLINITVKRMMLTCCGIYLKV